MFAAEQLAFIPPAFAPEMKLARVLDVGQAEPKPRPEIIDVHPVIVFQRREHFGFERGQAGPGPQAQSWSLPRTFRRQRGLLATLHEELNTR